MYMHTILYMMLYNIVLKNDILSTILWKLEIEPNNNKDTNLY